MTTPRLGSVVSVKFEGIVDSIDLDGKAVVKTSAGRTHKVSLTDSSSVTTVSGGPKYWPPESGDVWVSKKGDVVYHVLAKGQFHRRTGVSGVFAVSYIDAVRAYGDLELVFRNGGIK